MLQTECFTFNFIEENCYVCYDDSGEAVIIDCGAWAPQEKQALADFIRSRGLRPAHLLNTHSHFDHIFGDAFLCTTYGLHPEMHPAELDNYRHASEQMQLFLHRSLDFERPAPGRFLNAGDVVRCGAYSLEAIATPGHTAGGLCFYCPEARVLFSGDTLFRLFVGRTDLPGSSPEAMRASLRSLMERLPDDVTVYPGHGAPTTIGHERRNNPYIR